MKLKSFLLITSFLLFVPLANADQAAVTADSASANLEAAIFSAPTSPDCANAELPVFEPTPAEQALGTCGACSDSLCAGKSSGQFCKYQSGRYYYCRHAYVVCAVNDCQCWTGPLP
jgi:hypothetical protein